MTEWSPPELLQPLPRKIQTKMGFKYSLLGISFVILNVLIVMLFPGLLGAHRAESLKRRGILAEGYVTDLRIVPVKGGILYRVDYRFWPKIAEGRQNHEYISNSGVSQTQFESLQVGESTEVIYMPSRPDISNLQIVVDAAWNRPYRNLIDFAALLAAVFGGLSLVVTLLTYRVYRRERWMTQWGHAAEATIVSEWTVRHRGQAVVEITYQFRDNADVVVTGTRAVGRVKPSNLTVLYDPADSSKNMLYPTSFMVVSPVKKTPIPA